MDRKELSEGIHEDLSSTFDALIKAAENDPLIKESIEKDEKDEEGREDEVTETEEELEESTSDEAEDEPSEDDEESVGEDEDESELGYEPGTLEPNSGWDKETREGFKLLPQNMQEFMLKRYNEMQADYTRKTKDVAGIKRALAPAREDIDSAELTDAQAVQNLVGTHMLLKSKPSLGIQYVMRVYGVSLEDVQDSWMDDESLAKNLKETTRLSRAESELDAIKNTVTEEAQEKTKAEIAEFAESHEHFETVYEQMKEIARSDLISGKPKPSLDSLYERALWLNPETRQMMIEKESKGKPKTGKDVKNAKKANTRIKATPKTKKEKSDEPTNLHDELSQGWDKAMGA